MVRPRINVCHLLSSDMVSDSLWTRFAAASAASIPHKRSSAPTARSRPTTSTSPTRSSASSRTTRASARHQQPPDGRFEAHLDAQSQSTIVSAVLPPFPTSHKINTVAQAIPIEFGLDHLSGTSIKHAMPSTSASLTGTPFSSHLHASALRPLQLPPPSHKKGATVQAFHSASDAIDLDVAEVGRGPPSSPTSPKSPTLSTVTSRNSALSARPALIAACQRCPPC